MTKVKVQETKISVVIDDLALDALIVAVKENGLYVDKEHVKVAMEEMGWWHRQSVPYTIVVAEEYVRCFTKAVENLYFDEVDRWKDGRPQIDFNRFFQFTYKFTLVALVG